jgi:serine protease inhibitor
MEMRMKPLISLLISCLVLPVAAWARLTSNPWVEQKTDNKINDLLRPGVLDSSTRLLLTNAIDCKGDWQTPFDRAQTEYHSRK